MQGFGRDGYQLPRLSQPRGAGLWYPLPHPGLQGSTLCPCLSQGRTEPSILLGTIQGPPEQRDTPAAPGRGTLVPGSGRGRGTQSAPSSQRYLGNASSVLPPLLTQQAGTGYSNALSPSQETPPSKSHPRVPEPWPSPGHTDCAQLQPFIVGWERGTPQAASRSRSHTTNLVLVRELLLVAVSAWAWYPMATFCDKPRCSL